MKKMMMLVALTACCAGLFSGCLFLSAGAGSTTGTSKATVGRELVDLKKAKDAGALTDAEYEAEKAKLLNKK